MSPITNVISDYLTFAYRAQLCYKLISCSSIESKFTYKKDFIKFDKIVSIIFGDLERAN